MSSPRRQMCRRRHLLRTIGASSFPLLLRLRSGTWRIQRLWPIYRRRLVGRCRSPSQEIADGVATSDNDGYVRGYDANNGKLRSTVEGFLLEPFAVAFSQDGKSVVAGGADKSIVDPGTG